MSNFDVLYLSQQRKQKQDRADMIPILFTEERKSHYEQHKSTDKKSHSKNSK